ncbi:hypothetical protein M9H77_07653 [Catharanthus roseus]|uniref:Uncharacterized protein n=1 Tax=Catharanthus roseus TaxID=4058 RepID=A0ACC0BVJ6_CATRO|nr:hypothetical protein M9H77_07653 [Catharanthus roseus]
MQNRTFDGRPVSLYARHSEVSALNSSRCEECEKDESSKEEENDLKKNERAKENEKLEEETYFLDFIATMFEMRENIESLERKIEIVELENTSEKLKDQECVVPLVLEQSLNSLQRRNDAMEFGTVDCGVSTHGVEDQGMSGGKGVLLS